MPKRPTVHYRKVIKAFASHGWTKVRQEGSHVILVKDGHIATLSVPAKNPVARGTLRSLLRAAGLTVDAFVEALQ